MGDDGGTGTPGTDRRGVLRNLLALGSVAPVAALLSTAGGVAQAAAARAARAQVTLPSRQLAGQRVIYSYPGRTVPAALLQAISAGQAAGVIFFSDNVASDAQLKSVVAQLVQAHKKSPVAAPLLLMTDQEGGGSGGCPAIRPSRRSRSGRPATRARRRARRAPPPGATWPGWA